MAVDGTSRQHETLKVDVVVLSDVENGRPVRVISWNVKHFSGAIAQRGNAYDLIRRVVGAFDLAIIYEVPNSANGDTACADLVAALGGLYQHFPVPSLGLGNENDQVAVFWNGAIATVVNRTAQRRPGGFTGRQPVYFNVTDVATGNTKEMCAWHAPSPGDAQGWNRILNNSMDGLTALTGMIMGDFNSHPAVPRGRGAGRQFIKNIRVGGNNGTTLQPGLQGVGGLTSIAYRTRNTYDQFYTNATLIAPGASGLFDIISRLALNQFPFTNAYGRQYNTNRKAYTFYYGSVSDHLPVAIDVNIL